MNGSTRILANTLASYSRLFALALVGIVVTPLALRALGHIDYGVFSVIGGSLALFMFINGALTAGAQRHIAYSLGKGDAEEARVWFTTSLYIHACLGIVFTAAALLASDWLLHGLLNVPQSRAFAAMWIYRMIVVSMLCNIVSTPYQAFLMAHEEIVSLSVIGALSALSLLVGSLSLKMLPGDLLLWFSGIYSLSQVAMFVGPILFCVWRYPDCRHLERRAVQRIYVTDLLAFSGWNLFGAMACVMRAQGPAVLLNIFAGPVANASYGVALQANAFASNVGAGVLRATTPPIVKRRAAGNHVGMALLSNLSNTYAFGALWIVLAPVLFERDFCLRMWLRNPPPHCAAFVSLLLVAVLVDQLTSGFIAPLQATGRIAAYQVVVGTMSCIGVPAGYVMMRFGMPETSLLWAGIVAAALAGCCRVYFAKTRTGISLTSWFRIVLIPCAACTLSSGAAIIALRQCLHPGLNRFVATSVVNVAIAGLVLWRFGTPADYRARLKAQVLLRIRPLEAKQTLHSAVETAD